MYLIVYGNSDQDTDELEIKPPVHEIIYFNPLCSNGLFLLVCCIYLGMVHCLYRGITGYKFQIKIVFLSLKIVLFLLNVQTLTDYSAFDAGLHCLPMYPLKDFAYGPIAAHFYMFTEFFPGPLDDQVLNYFYCYICKLSKTKCLSYLCVTYVCFLLSCDFPQIFVLLSTQDFLFKYGIAICR